MAPKYYLNEDGGATVMRYEVQADVGGKLAQLGERLIEGTAKELAGEFFTSFKKEITGPEDEAAEVTVPAATRPVATTPAATKEETGIGAVHSLVLIIGGAIALGVLFLLIGSI